MDQKYLAEIRTRDNAELPETAAPVFRDRHALLAEVERQDRQITTLKAEVERLHDCKCVDKCKLVCMLDEYDKIVGERNTLKRALELMVVSLRENNFNCPDADYFIQQAQEREGHDGN